MSKILITGATGSLGGQVINELLKKEGDFQIVAMGRDLSKLEGYQSKGIEVRQGDYDDFESLEKAFQGIDKLYFVSGSDIGNRLVQHENVVKAAKSANVQHVVYTSFERKNETDSSPLAAVAAGHLRAEALLKESGLSYTFLRHNLYMDLLPMFIGENVLEQGMIYLPAGQGKTSFVLRAEMAAASAAVLTTSGHEHKEYKISAPETHSFEEFAVILSELSGKDIKYISPSTEEFQKTLHDLGVPEPVIGITTGFALGIAEDDLDVASDDIEKLTGSKPTDVKTFLTSVYKK